MKQSSETVWQKKTFVSYLLSVLVFWIHCSSFENYTALPSGVVAFWQLCQDVITPAAVPLFFVLSGATFFRNYSPDSFRRKLKSRVRSLVVPYLCWNVLNMLFEILASAFLSRYFVGRQLFTWSIGSILRGIFLFGYNGPFWFVFFLILFTFTAPVFDLLTRNRWVGIAAAAVLAVVTNWELPIVWIRTGMTCTVYYLCGALLGRYLWNWLAAASGKKTQLACGVALIVINAVRFYGLRHGLGLMSALKAFALVGEGLCIWFLADAVFASGKFRPGAFMEHSFFVYAMHMNVSAVITKLFFLVTGDRWFLAPVNFLLTTALTLAMIEIACIILKKWFPPVFAVLSGNR